MITRDIIQGFIDGHKVGGHSKDCMKPCLKEYLVKHHTYPVDDLTADKILTDVDSYKK